MLENCTFQSNIFKLKQIFDPTFFRLPALALVLNRFLTEVISGLKQTSLYVCRNLGVLFKDTSEG